MAVSVFELRKSFRLFLGCAASASADAFTTYQTYEYDKDLQISNVGDMIIVDFSNGVEYSSSGY